MPATGTFGVGSGEGVAVGANATVVGVGVRVGVAVAPGTFVGVGVEVGPGVLVGVDVGVLVGVPVGVLVGADIEKVRVHAGAAAAGVSCGTVGATGSSRLSFCVVRKITTPSPAVTKVSKRRCQCFLIAFMGLAPISVYKYFRFDRKIRDACRDRKVYGILVTCVFTRRLGKRAAVDSDAAFRGSGSLYGQYDIVAGHECGRSDDRSAFIDFQIAALGSGRGGWFWRIFRLSLT